MSSREELIDSRSACSKTRLTRCGKLIYVKVFVHLNLLKFFCKSVIERWVYSSPSVVCALFYESVFFQHDENPPVSKCFVFIKWATSREEAPAFSSGVIPQLKRNFDIFESKKLTKKAKVPPPQQPFMYQKGILQTVCGNYLPPINYHTFLIKALTGYVIQIENSKTRAFTNSFCTNECFQTSLFLRPVTE